MLHNFINNEFVPSHSAATFDLVSLVDETVVGVSSLSDAADVDKAGITLTTRPNSISMSSYSPSAPHLGCPS